MLSTMKTLTEQPFIINGVKSWIHCLVCEIESATEQVPNLHHSHDILNCYMHWMPMHMYGSTENSTDLKPVI